MELTRKNCLIIPKKERKIWHKTNSVAFEKNTAMSHQSSDDVLRLLDYSSYFRLMGLSLPSNKDGIIEKLSAEKLIKKIGDVYSITNLGGILFAHGLNVRQSDLFD